MRTPDFFCNFFIDDLLDKHDADITQYYDTYLLLRVKGR